MLTKVKKDIFDEIALQYAYQAYRLCAFTRAHIFGFNVPKDPQISINQFNLSHLEHFARRGLIIFTDPVTVNLQEDSDSCSNPTNLVVVVVSQKYPNGWRDMEFNRCLYEHFKSESSVYESEVEVVPSPKGYCMRLVLALNA